jgi:hypothetical protein
LDPIAAVMPNLINKNSSMGHNRQWFGQNHVEESFEIQQSAVADGGEQKEGQGNCNDDRGI